MWRIIDLRATPSLVRICGGESINLDVEVSLRRLLKSSNDLLRSVVLHMRSVCDRAATVCYWGHEGDRTNYNETAIGSLDMWERFILTHELSNPPPVSIISSYFSLTRIRQENREAADNGFLAEDVSGKLRYPVQLIVKATSGVCWRIWMIVFKLKLDMGYNHCAIFRCSCKHCSVI